jgi:phospholipid transport system substrate-binding protein
MQRTLQRWALVIALASFLLVGRGVIAHAGEPQELIRQMLESLTAVLKDASLKAPEQRQAQRAHIAQVVAQYFDFAEMSRRSLEHHWHRLTPAQQQEFVQLFSALLQQSLVGRIAYRAKTPSAGYGHVPSTIRYTGETIDQAGYASVQTAMTYEGDQATEDIEYLLLRRNGTWKVYDIIAEGASTVTNYRTEFDKIIRQESYADLLKRLKMSQQ